MSSTLTREEIEATMALHGWRPISCTDAWVGVYRSSELVHYRIDDRPVMFGQDCVDGIQHVRDWLTEPWVEIRTGEPANLAWREWCDVGRLEDVFAFIALRSLL